MDGPLNQKTLCEASTILDINSIPLTVSNKTTLELDDKQREKLQSIIAAKLTIAKKKDFEKLDLLVKAWYPNDEKFRKAKLGSLFQCRMPDRNELMCRVMTFDRISSYQVEGYFANVAKLSYLRL